jgi:hypothetical protein
MLTYARFAADADEHAAEECGGGVFDSEDKGNTEGRIH